jgi:hypothetical protein
MTLPLGRYLIAPVHNGQAAWDQCALVDKHQTPALDEASPAPGEYGNAGEANEHPRALRLAGRQNHLRSIK